MRIEPDFEQLEAEETAEPARIYFQLVHAQASNLHTAKVPVVISFLDFENKVGGVGPGFVPTGDIQADMDKIRAFYDGMKGFRPELSTLMMLKEEMTEEAQAA